MKKKLTKKLLLNKETISQLQDEESRNIKGGLTVDYDTCKCNTAKSCSDGLNCCPSPPPEKLDN
ncbi:MAG: class I lanthipeptide [Candidatus Aminicenantes bacterium]|nr:class I lanthipeptide [Candidatus Aminicenantes bacterium]